MIHPTIQILANKIRENPHSFINTLAWDDTWTRLARKYDIIFTDEERKIIEDAIKEATNIFREKELENLTEEVYQIMAGDEVSDRTTIKSTAPTSMLISSAMKAQIENIMKEELKKVI